MIVLSDPPKLFTPPFDKIYHKMGSEALMTCGLKKGSLPLSFKWFKNGQIIQSTDSVSIGTNDFASNLVFKSLSMSDAGEYTCTVSNTFGSDSITIKVIVEGLLIKFVDCYLICFVVKSIEGPPQWTTKPIDVLLRPANKGILKCIPTGNPEPTVVWKKQIGKIEIEFNCSQIVNSFCLQALSG